MGSPPDRAPSRAPRGVPDDSESESAPTDRSVRHRARMASWPAAPAGEEELFERLRRLCDEGVSISNRIMGARDDGWHSFVPADYSTILRALLRIRSQGGAFLELGSAIGVITIMADLLGFEACGIEVAPELVDEARELARRYDSDARFAAGSFLVDGYEWVSETGDRRLGTVGVGEPAYAELGHQLDHFDWVYVYPWPGESAVIRDMMRQRGAPGATLLVNDSAGGLEVPVGGSRSVGT